MVARTCIIVLAVMLRSGSVQAAPPPAIQTLDHHIGAMKSGDLKAVMADYAEDALVIAPHGIGPSQKTFANSDIFVGRASISKLFAVLTDRNHLPGNRSMVVRYEPLANDVVAMHWRQNPGTSAEVTGVDLFVIRDQKITSQNIMVDGARH